MTTVLPGHLASQRHSLAAALVGGHDHDAPDHEKPASRLRKDHP
ncbi:hypothetical protein J2X81_000821 [Sinomonas atrocyanea]|jgi:hypothetical protein|nr:hypothetical protein [Sinomonas atrocyanea]MDR6620583.1 hypothetical protein [Sinomonas atrocyanea]